MSSTSNDENVEIVPDAVGYGRPPLHSRFKPGKSGNPKGRPTKPRKSKGILDAALARKVTVIIGGRSKRVSVMEAACLNLSNKVATGDLKALEMVVRLQAAFGRDGGIQEDMPDTTRPDDEAVVAEFLHRRGEAIDKGGGS